MNRNKTFTIENADDSFIHVQKYDFITTSDGRFCARINFKGLWSEFVLEYQLAAYMRIPDDQNIDCGA